MKLLTEGKSKALSACSLAAAALCAAMTVKAARDLWMLLQVLSAPAFYLSLRHATLPMEMPPLAAFIVGHARLFFAFLLSFWLSGLVLAAGVWARREWARRGAVWLLYLAAAAALLLLVQPWLAIPKPLMYGGISLAPEFNDAVRIAAFFARFAAAVCGALALWWALLLDRGALKREFS